MGRTALSKIQEGKELKKLSDDLKQSFPTESAQLKTAAARKIASGIKQMTGPRRKRVRSKVPLR